MRLRVGLLCLPLPLPCFGSLVAILYGKMSVSSFSDIWTCALLTGVFCKNCQHIFFYFLHIFNQFTHIEFFKFACSVGYHSNDLSCVLFSYAECVVVNELGINWLERPSSRILNRTKKKKQYYDG